MKNVVLTCVSCGKTKEVLNNTNAVRNQHCECGSSTIERSHSGAMEQKTGSRNRDEKDAGIIGH